MEHYKNLNLQDIEGEVWKDVVGYEGKYIVSNFGRVKGLKRNSPVVEGNHAYRSVKERIMKQRISENGYLRVGLRSDRKCKCLLVHRTVMIAFYPIENKTLVVNHKDLNKTNNVLSNLEWTTNKENSSHAMINGAIKSFGENHYFSKISEIQAIEIKTKFRKGGISRIELANEYGLHLATVTQLINGHSWKHLLKLESL